MGKYDELLYMFNNFSGVRGNKSSKYNTFEKYGYDKQANPKLVSDANELINKLIGDIRLLQKYDADGYIVNHPMYNKRTIFAYGSLLYSWYRYSEKVLNSYREDNLDEEIIKVHIHNLGCTVFKKDFFNHIQDCYNDKLKEMCKINPDDLPSYASFLKYAYQVDVDIENPIRYTNLGVTSNITPFDDEGEDESDTYYDVFCIKSYCNLLSKSLYDNMTSHYDYFYPDTDLEDLDITYYVQCLTGIYNICDANLNMQNAYTELDDIIFVYVAGTFKKLLLQMDKNSIRFADKFSLSFELVDLWCKFYTQVYDIAFPRTNIPVLNAKRQFIFMQLLANSVREYFDIQCDSHIYEAIPTDAVSNDNRETVDQGSLIPFISKNISNGVDYDLSTVILKYHDFRSVEISNSINLDAGVNELVTDIKDTLLFENYIVDDNLTTNEYMKDFITDLVHIRHEIRSKLYLSDTRNGYDIDDIDISELITNFKDRYLKDMNNYYFFHNYPYSNAVIYITRKNSSIMDDIENELYPGEQDKFPIVDMMLPDYNQYDWSCVNGDLIKNMYDIPSQEDDKDLTGQVQSKVQSKVDALSF